MKSTSALTLAVLSVLPGACSSSSPHDTSDAGPQADATALDAASSDAGDDAEADDASDASEGIDAPPTPVFSLDAGSTWTALYRDYFGNNTQSNAAGCANQSYCHGSTSGDGYQASQFLCPKGDKAGCYASITSPSVTTGPGLITADASASDDYLTQVLCRVDDAGNATGDGVMPQDCVYSFTPTDIQRITTWIKAGYPDN
jgi:hypothetical protein